VPNETPQQKNYERIEVQLQSPLAHPLYGDKRPVSDAFRFTSSETASRVHYVVGMARPPVGPGKVDKDADALSLSKIQLRFLGQVAARSKITTQ
jgi:hypothetical protein